MRMNQTIKQLPSGDFEVMEIANYLCVCNTCGKTLIEKQHFLDVLIELQFGKQQAVEQYKAGLVEWLLETLDNSNAYVDSDKFVKHIVEHIEADNEKV